MKKCIIVLALGLLCAASIFGQESKQIVPTFKNIKVEGNFNDMINKLKNIGLTLTEIKDNIAIFNGSFAGYDNCYIYCVGSKYCDRVLNMSIFLPIQRSWYNIKSQYDSMANMFKIKYGEPNSDYHFFSNPYYDGDGYEMTAIEVDKCHYACFWYFDGYSIDITISSTKSVRITYENEANVELHEHSKNKLIFNEI